MRQTFSEVKHALQNAKGKVVAVVGAVTLGSTSAMSAFDGSTFGPDVTPIEAIAAAMLTVLAIIWVIRRAISLASR